MPKSGKKTYYWDTSAFIAWLNGGKGHAVEVISGFDEVARDVNENRAILCTSVITQTEVLQGKLTAEQQVRLQNLFKRRNVNAIGVDSRIAQKASEIRNCYHQRNIKIDTPDSLHLATAIIYEVDEFNTTDGDGKRQRPSDLLRLNGDVAGHPLHIRIPTAVQPSLLAGVDPLPEDESSVKGKNEKSVPQATPDAGTTQLRRGGNGSASDKAGAKVAKKEATPERESAKRPKK